MPNHNPSNRKYRLLIVASHPVQYASPLFRLLAESEEPNFEILVAYCSLQGAKPGIDPEFGVEVAWDIPLLEGYPWIQLPNKAPKAGLGHFFGLINPRLWKLVRRGNFDAIVVYGYAYFSFGIAILAAKRAKIPVIIGTDSVRLKSPRSGWWWKRWVKTLLVRFIYQRLADIVLVPSTVTRHFMRSLDIAADKLVMTHYTVDNEYFAKSAAEIDRTEARQKWGLSPDAFVILFCAKLASWKRPQDVLRAFAEIRKTETEAEAEIDKVGAWTASTARAGLKPAPTNSTYLIFAGDGPLRQSLESEAQELGVAEHVRFLGFVNQSKLPEVYAASDILVLPSEHEPWGLVVNEAMASGIPVIVSDRVGSGYDLICEICEGKTGFSYPLGKVKALASILRRLLADPEELKRMGEAAKKRMETWSYREHLEGLVEAVEKAVGKKIETRTGNKIGNRIGTKTGRKD